MTILAAISAISAIVFLWFCYLAYQDARYAIQDPFMLWGFGGSFVSALVFGIAAWMVS